MSKLYVVRHGAYERSGLNRSDERLTDKGIIQAERAGALLLSMEEVGIKWQLLTSAAPRAVESAKVIGEIIGASPIISDMVYRAGNSPDTVDGNLIDFAGDAMRKEAADYDLERPLAMVAHLPLMTCIAGDPRATIENGAVLEYDPEVWRDREW